MSDLHNTTAWILSHAMVSIVEMRFGANWATELWHDRLEWVYRGGMNQAVCDHLGFEHPLTQYWVDT